MIDCGFIIEPDRLRRGVPVFRFEEYVCLFP